MKIGYPCINTSLSCRGNRTFRLQSYSERRLIETVKGNLDCLLEMLVYNVEHGILFFRITSDMIPFASHPVCTFDWQAHFRDNFAAIGEFIARHAIRISVHPDQFNVLNALDPAIVERTVRELQYHADLLDALQLLPSAKMQIHVGGVYGDKEQSILRFAERYADLDPEVRRRLVVENDDHRFTVKDCMRIHELTGIPVLFDAFHHSLHSSGEPQGEAALRCSRTWKPADGIPMVDYSSRMPGGRRGSHAASIDPDDFSRFLKESFPLDFDIMLEIKDKEKSALLAIEIAADDPRFVGR